APTCSRKITGSSDASFSFLAPRAKERFPEGIAIRYSRRPTTARAPTLFRRHADGAVEADGLAVQHVVLDDAHGKLGIFLGIAQPRRERHLRAETLLRLGRQPHHHRCQKETRRNGADADAQA